MDFEDFCFGGPLAVFPSTYEPNLGHPMGEPAAEDPDLFQALRNPFSGGPVKLFSPDLELAVADMNQNAHAEADLNNLFDMTTLFTDQPREPIVSEPLTESDFTPMATPATEVSSASPLSFASAASIDSPEMSIFGQVPSSPSSSVFRSRTASYTGDEPLTMQMDDVQIVPMPIAEAVSINRVQTEPVFGKVPMKFDSANFDKVSLERAAGTKVVKRVKTVPSPKVVTANSSSIVIAERSTAPTQASVLVPSPQIRAMTNTINTNLTVGSVSELSPTIAEPLGANQMAPAQQEVPDKPFSQWVKLTRMSAARATKIRTLAQQKGVEMDTVDSILQLYSSPGRVDTEVYRYSDGDNYIKITMNGGLSSDESSRRRRKHSADHVKRPLNSFMLYRKSQTHAATAFAESLRVKINHQNISQIIGLLWQTESKELRDTFGDLSKKEKALHKQLHPDYKFCPQKKPVVEKPTDKETEKPIDTEKSTVKS